MKLQQQPHSSDVIGQNARLPLRVKNKKKNIGVEKHLHRERKFKVAKVHHPHVLQDQNYP